MEDQALVEGSVVFEEEDDPGGRAGQSPPERGVPCWVSRSAQSNGGGAVATGEEWARAGPAGAQAAPSFSLAEQPAERGSPPLPPGHRDTCPSLRLSQRRREHAPTGSTADIPLALPRDWDPETGLVLPAPTPAFKPQ